MAMARRVLAKAAYVGPIGTLGEEEVLGKRILNFTKSDDESMTGSKKFVDEENRGIPCWSAVKFKSWAPAWWS
ncbi:hypothetical protein V1477_010880 [Vespula maculifrons]|uniref:Uncharacterized protein n=1 Tax=Vespula maculifrons TaxID=7453 RepID=A0ABD2C373_VESMC